MSKEAERKAAAEKLRGSVLAYRDPMEPAGDWSEWSALDEDELSVAELRRKVWDEVVELFDGDEIGAIAQAKPQPLDPCGDGAWNPQPPGTQLGEQAPFSKGPGAITPGPGVDIG